ARFAADTHGVELAALRLAKAAHDAQHFAEERESYDLTGPRTHEPSQAHRLLAGVYGTFVVAQQRPHHAQPRKTLADAELVVLFLPDAQRPLEQLHRGFGSPPQRYRLSEPIQTPGLEVPPPHRARQMHRLL